MTRHKNCPGWATGAAKAGRGNSDQGYPIADLPGCQAACWLLLQALTRAVQAGEQAEAAGHIGDREGYLRALNRMEKHWRIALALGEVVCGRAAWP